MKFLPLAFIVIPLGTMMLKAKENCDLIERTYTEQIQSKYHSSYIIDKSIFFTVGIESKFMYYFRHKIPKRILIEIVKRGDTTRQRKDKIECFEDNEIYDKAEIIAKIRAVDVTKFIADSSFVRYVDNRQAEILKIADETKRQDELSELMQTPEFKRYDKAIDYFTPRIVELSKPVVIENYCFLRINVSKNYTDDMYGVIYVCHKSNNVWKLLDKWSVIE